VSGRVKAGPGSAIPEGMQAAAAASGQHNGIGSSSTSGDSAVATALKPEPVSNITEVIAMQPLRGYTANKDGLKMEFSVRFVNLDDERRWVRGQCDKYRWRWVCKIM